MGAVSGEIVFNYKKPAFWTIVGVVVLSITVAVCFMTNPVTKITDLKDDWIDYSTIFNDVEQITAVKGDIEYLISYDEDISAIKYQFERIRIKETIIYHSESDPLDTTNYIVIGGNMLCFSKDFSRFCGMCGPSSLVPPSYKISNPHAAKKLFDLIANSESNRVNRTLTVQSVRTGTKLGGVTVSVKNISLDIKEPLIEYEIKNESENQYTYGDFYRFFYTQEGKRVSCSTFKASGKRVVLDSAHILKPKSTNVDTYALHLIDFSKKGKYTLESDEWWIEFELANK